jgi:hypothetical protein
LRGMRQTTSGAKATSEGQGGNAKDRRRGQMALQFSREQVEMMLKNVGPEGEALVVLPQSEYDALVANVARYEALQRNIRGCVPNSDELVNAIADSFLVQEAEAAAAPTNSEWAGGQDFFCWKCGGRTHREVGLCDACVPDHGTATPAGPDEERERADLLVKALERACKQLVAALKHSPEGPSGWPVPVWQQYFVQAAADNNELRATEIANEQSEQARDNVAAADGVPMWAVPEFALIFARERGNLSSWGYDHDSHGKHVYFTRTALDARRQFRSATRADAARQAASYVGWLYEGRGRPEPTEQAQVPAENTSKPQWVCHKDTIKFGLQSAKQGPCATACRGKCWWECEYEHDEKCAVIRLIDEEDPDAPAGDVDYRCDLGYGGHQEAEDERTKANVQDCWRRRIAMGEAFRVEP